MKRKVDLEFDEPGFIFVNYPSLILPFVCVGGIFSNGNVMILSIPDHAQIRK